jgi:hypothetical protein
MGCFVDLAANKLSYYVFFSSNMTDLADLYQPDLLLEEFTLACAAIVVVPVEADHF